MDEKKPPYNRSKEHKTPEEKAKILDEAIAFLRGFVMKGNQGNISFPCYDGIVGKAKVETYVDPLEAKNIFKLGAE